MPSVTSWTRLEPHPSSPQMPGFAARVADPLWLLARQWQLGELTGEDAGSPVRVDLVADTAPLTRYLPRLPDGSPGDPVDRAVPLEAVVEGERGTVPALLGADDRTAASAGADLLAQLGGLGSTLRAALVARYPLPAPDPDASPATRRRADLLRRRVPDGRQLLPALQRAQAAGDASSALPGLDRTDPTSVLAARTAAESWLAVTEARPLSAGQPPAAWRAERLDYEFAVAAPAGAGGEWVLAADGHPGGRLDWWSLEARPGATLGAAADPGPATVTATGLPARVGGAGLPAARFWELESGDVNLDAVSAAPEDLGRLLFMEFAVVYGSDFFAVPLELDVGSVTVVQSLTVLTTFGETVAVPPADQADAAAGRPPFRLFQPSVADGGRTDAEPWLLVLPTVLGGLAGPPVEEVVFSRDEMANLAWAVERIVPGVDGRGMDRAAALYRAAPQPTIHTGEPQPPAQRYRLVTPVPANWLPMRPATSGAIGADRPVLRLSGPAPTGTLLAPGAELHAERLDRAGIRLSRRFERARAADGRPLSWVSRRTGVGRGASSSGLRFDDLVAGA
jgi:hypothetical protein